MYKTRYAAMIAFFTALISVTVFITESVFGAAGSNAPTTPSTCALYGTCYALGWEEYSVDETPPGTKKLANGDIEVYGTDQGAGSATIKASLCGG